jgi:hypothetical protein
VTTLKEVEGHQLSERGRASGTKVVPCPASRLAVASPLAPRSRQGHLDHVPRFSGMRWGKPICEIPVHSLKFGTAIALLMPGHGPDAPRHGPRMTRPEEVAP